MLTAKSHNEPYVEAANAVRDQTYMCRGCEQPVIFKAGRVRTWHFAHHPNSKCPYGALMSPEHLAAQRVLADALRSREVHVELEAQMNSLAGDRRIDVLAWPPDRQTARVAIEVQASDITIHLIDERTNSYQAEGVAPLWLRLYDFARWDDPKLIVQRRTIWIPKHHLRSWERWVYDHLGGRLWFMDSRTLLIWRGIFVPAHSYVEQTSWYGPGGEEQSAGGDWRDITRWVELELEGPFAPRDLRLKRGRVTGADHKQRLAAWFLPPGEDGDPGPPPVRAKFLTSKGWFFTPRQIQVRIGEVWEQATVEEAPPSWADGT